jgi:hypothetical protein
MTANTLAEVQSLIKTAKSVKDLFGDQPERTYKHLLRVCHPDRNRGEKLAGELYNQIGKLYRIVKLSPSATDQITKTHLHTRQPAHHR